MPRRALVVACLFSIVPLAHSAEPVLPPAGVYQTADHWRQPIPSFQIADSTWYIGTAGLSALLIKTPEGAVLIDGGLPQAADTLLKRMRELEQQIQELKAQKP